MNEENILKIGSVIGLVNEVHTDSNLNPSGTRFMWFNVEVDITKPIPIGFVHKTILEKRWIQFTYKRMVNICYNCRRFGHF